jgi:transcription antitermination factor NusG
LDFKDINGKSHLKIEDNINSGAFIDFLIEIKLLNSEKEETKVLLKELLEKENVQENYNSK